MYDLQLSFRFKALDRVVMRILYVDVSDTGIVVSTSML